MVLHPVGSLVPFLLLYDLTPGEDFYTCPVFHADTCFAPGAFFSATSTVSISPAQDKTLAKHCQLAHPKPSCSSRSQKLSGVGIVIARKLYIYRDLSDTTVNAFQSTRSVKINCKEIKTAN